jgi:RNA polymerase sigma-70 factor (ECF subfamily)
VFLRANILRLKGLLMSADEPFRDLIRRVRAGDENAAAELVRLYEPHIRRVARIRLVDARLRRVLDSLDVCQSVLASFFVRAALGQYELNKPEQLLKLLTTMTCHKVAEHAHKEQAKRRDIRRVRAGSAAQKEIAARDESPSEQVAAQELLHEFRKRLSEEERQLAELRAQGREWAEIAAECGGSAEGLRKRLARAVDRVARALGIEGPSHESA